MAMIVHTTALTAEDRVSLAHCVALANASSAELVSLHANDDPESSSAMPGAEEMLREWGKDPADVTFRKVVHNCCDDPVDTVLDAVRKLEPDLVAAAAHQRSVISRLFGGSSSEALAHNLSIPTLLFPPQVRGFVDGSGTLDLRRMLVPAGDPEAAQAGVHRAAWLAELAGIEELEIVVLHVGDEHDVPAVRLPERPGWTMKVVNAEGSDIEQAIVDHARDACLIVMATRGVDSVSDVVRGSHTDRVLHKAQCPLLSVPLAS